MRHQSDFQEQPQSELVECINGILRVTKYREENYFRVLDFVKKNMESLSRQMTQITIVHKFLVEVDQQESALLKQEEVLIVQHSSSAAHCKKYASAYCRLIGRMSARLFELFESSIQRIRSTIFYTQKIEEDFNLFRHSINRSLSAERVNFNMAATIILKYSKSKYGYEVGRLKRFLLRIQGGAETELRQYYLGTQDYESDKSPQKQQRDSSLKKKISISENRRGKETSKPKEKKQQNKFSKSSDKEESPRHSKPAAINKIMKLYNVLDPSKTQFLEDMIYSEPEEAHRTRLFNSLWEKNRAIDQQIKQYHRKVQFMTDRIKDLQEQLSKPISDHQGSDINSGGERGRSNLFKSQANIKTNSFIISKPRRDSNNFMIRKSRRELLEEQNQQTDFVVNSAGQFSSGAEYASDTNQGAATDRQMVHIGRIGKNSQGGSGKRKPVSKSLFKRAAYPDYASRPVSRDGNVKPQQSPQPQSQSQVQSQPQTQNLRLVSRGSTKNRIFVVKSPTLFQDENLHSRMVVNTGKVTKKQQQTQSIKTSRSRPTTKRMSRSVLGKDQKIEKPEKTIQQTIGENAKSFFQQKVVMEDRLVFDPEKFKQLGGKKQFNLRLKKHMKKSVMVSDRLFIEQTNEQINSYNF